MRQPFVLGLNHLPGTPLFPVSLGWRACSAGSSARLCSCRRGAWAALWWGCFFDAAFDKRLLHRIIKKNSQTPGDRGMESHRGSVRERMTGECAVSMPSGVLPAQSAGLRDATTVWVAMSGSGLFRVRDRGVCAHEANRHSESVKRFMKSGASRQPAYHVPAVSMGVIPNGTPLGPGL